MINNITRKEYNTTSVFEGIGLCKRQFSFTLMNGITMATRHCQLGGKFIRPGDLPECPNCICEISEELVRARPGLGEQFNEHRDSEQLGHDLV